MAEKKPIIVDTDIFIKVFRGDSIRKKYLDALKGRIAISVITALELYQGANTNVENMISKNNFALITYY